MIGANAGDSRVQRLLDQLEIKYQIDRDGDSMRDGRAIVSSLPQAVETPLFRTGRP